MIIVMLFNSVSFILIIVIACYYLFYLFQRRAMLTTRAGAFAASVFAFIFSFGFGVIASQTFELQLILSLAISVAFAIVVGFCFGIWFRMTSAINGALFSSVGALLGSVIGGMFYTSKIVIMVADIVFIIAVFLVQKIVDWHINRSSSKKAVNNTKANKPSYFVTGALSATVIILAVLILALQNQIGLGAIGRPQVQTAVFDEENNLQVATIKVMPSGFAPLNTEFKPYTMIKAIFNVEPSAGENLRLISKDLNIDVVLKIGENTFLLNNPQPGHYDFTIESKSYKSTFTVQPVKK